MSCIFPSLCAAGGIAFHIWRKQMLHFFFSGARAAFPSLSLFPLPPQRSLTPPHISFECVCVCLFCTKIAAVLVVWAARSSRRVFLFITMGDIEAPSSNRPPQAVLKSILPSKEFVTSRKGMLLIAEVVRNDPMSQASKSERQWTVVSPKAQSCG